MPAGSWPMSKASLASICMRKASSKDWMRASSRESSRARPQVLGIELAQQIELPTLHRARGVRAADILDQLLQLRVLRSR